MGKLTWAPAKVALGSMRTYAGNPRLSTKAQAERIIESERRFGQPLPFLLNPPEPDGSYPLLDGHQRLAAWLTVYGAAHVMDAMVASRALTEAEHKQLIITLHTGAQGSWDWSVLSSWDSKSLQDWGMDADTLKDWNNDANNLKELLRAEGADADHHEAVPDTRADELQAKWGTEVGQLWRVGFHVLACGDCSDAGTLARLMNGTKAALLFTDPPYGVERDKGFDGAGGFDGRGHPIPRRKYKGAWDAERPAPETFELLLKQAETAIIFGGNYFADLLPKSTHWLVWDKHNTMPTFGDCELAWTSFPRKSVKQYDVEYNGLIGKEADRWHPTQKPVKLYDLIIADYTEPGAVVLDPYAGSGTILVSCQNTDRRALACELSPAYAAVCLERMALAFPGIRIGRLDMPKVET